MGTGWEPLCKVGELCVMLAQPEAILTPKVQFLNEPVPNVPFPWVNDKADFTRFMAKQVMHGLMRWCGIIVALAFAVAAILFW